MRFASLIFRNLTRRPARSTLTLLALATAITAVVSLFGIAQGFTRAFAEVYSAHGVDIVVSRQGSADRLSSSVDNQFSSKIQEIPGVLKAAGVMLETLSLEQEGIYGVPTLGISSGSWLLDNYQFVRGSRPSLRNATNSQQAEESDPEKWILLGIHLADRIEKNPGDTVALFDEPYRVAGVFQSNSTWENGSMVLPLATLQELTDRPGQVTYINVVIDREAQVSKSAEEVTQSIQELDRRLLALTTSEYVDTDTRMQIASAMAWMTSAIALMMGSFSTLNTMLTSVLERTKEIGILRAIGWPRRRVVGMILSESCGLCLSASVLGVVSAKLITWALSQSPTARGLISPHIDGKAIALGLILALSIGLIGAALPALRAARLSPTEAFRES